jgi:hypothetical protein
MIRVATTTDASNIAALSIQVWLHTSCLVAERCWDRVRWAIEEYTWRFERPVRSSPRRRT